VSLLIIFCFAVLIVTLIWSLSTLRTSRGDALGIPMVAVGSFTMVYLLQPLATIQSGAVDSFLTERMLAKAILVPAIMLACFMRGWLHTVRVSTAPKTLWNPHRLWNFGLGTAIAGLSLYATFIAISGGGFSGF
jgi:hypothetical protein